MSGGGSNIRKRTESRGMSLYVRLLPLINTRSLWIIDDYSICKEEHMNRQDFQHRIREAIPLAASMQLEAVEVSPEKVILKAPFGPNRNNHGTVFGGSIATLMLLTGWALLQPRMEEEVQGSLAVIARSDVSYRVPVEGDVYARTHPLNTPDLARFMAELREKGKAVIKVKVSAAGFLEELEAEGWEKSSAANFTGTFVGMMK